MKLIHVAACVLNQTPLDWQRNRQNILTAFQQSRRRGATILCLPELCITGYGCEDAFHSPGIHQTSLDVLQSIAAESGGLVACVGLPVLYAGGVFNAVCVLVDGRIAGFVAKQHLAGDGIHYEQRWFKPWPEGICGTIEVNGIEYPIGDLLFDIGGVRIGFEICEDAWVGSRPGAKHAARGADMILNPSASHFAFGKHAVRRRFVLEGSRAFQVTYLYANLVGNEAGRAIYDGDGMIACDGELLCTGPRLGYQHCYVTSCQVDIDRTRLSRARSGSFEPDVDGDESDVIQVEFQFPEPSLEQPESHPPNWESSQEIKHEEFTRSVCLGLLDYLCKSRSGGFVISLSGGADSAATAVLASLAIHLACDELGLETLQERLGGWSRQARNLADLVRIAITTVYQSTRNSSQVTRDAAADVAGETGSQHLHLDVDGLVQEYESIVASAMQIDLNWEQHDIPLQNIQSRVRSPSVWLIANIRNALLLSTSNRSESAVGYATMDGDTSGGLSPLAGIDKAYLRTWLRWMELQGPCGFRPMPSLKSVNQQQPTAELRPPSKHQTDEDDLMPYEILDQIERLAIRDKMMPVDILEHLRTTHPQASIQQLGTWVKRFFQLWCRNQWKRERYAPSFHLDDENLDPKTWCRFPILSGGFRRELEQLDQHIGALKVNR